MKIERIKFENMRGRSGEHALAELNVVTADPAKAKANPSLENGAGKSAELHAIVCGLYGYHPARGKSNGDVMAMASTDELKVDLLFDDGRVNHLEGTRKKGTCSVKFTAGVEMPLVTLDASQYFGMTEEQRISSVFNAGFRSAEWDEQQRDIAKLLSTMSIAAPVGHAMAAVSEVVDHWNSQLPGAKAGVPKWLETLRAEWKARAKAAGDRAKQFAAQIAGVRTTLPAPTVDVSSKIATAQAEASRLVTEIGRINGLVQAAEAQKLRMKRLEAIAASVDGAKKTLAAAEAALDKSLKSPVKGPSVSSAVMTERIQSLMRTIAQMNRDDKRHSDELSRLAALAHATLGEPCCPTCHADGVEWKDRWIKGNDAAVRSIKANKSACLKVLLGAEKDKKAAQDDLDAALELEVAVASYGEKVEILKEEVSKASAAVENAQAAKRELISIKREQGAIPDAQAVQVELSTAQTTLNTLRDAQRLHDDRGRTIKQIEDLESSSSLQSARQAAYKEAGDIVRQKQEALVAGVFDRLLVRANEFADGFLRGPMEYRDGTIGYLRTDLAAPVFVSHEDFSGFEKVVAYAGLCTALAADSPLRIVLVDDVVIADENKRRLFGRFQWLIEQDKLDQLVLVDVNADWLTKAQRELVNVIEV